LILQIEWEAQAALEKAMPPAQVDLEGGSQRVPMPLGLGHVFAGAPNARVVGADNDPLEALLLDGPLQNRMEEGARLPRATGKDLVIGRPVLLGVAVEGDGAGEGASAHAAEDAESQGDGPLQATVLREDAGPAGGLFEQVGQELHGVVRWVRKAGCNGLIQSDLRGQRRVWWRS